ncbi:hypothetical protein [Alkaliphilus metalliredigens]|nr:hypothetical protein [Alkaliphilus metalliredigens]
MSNYEISKIATEIEKYVIPTASQFALEGSGAFAVLQIFCERRLP